MDRICLVLALGLAGTVVMVSGCGVFNPYIRHDTVGKGPSGCLGVSGIGVADPIDASGHGSGNGTSVDQGKTTPKAGTALQYACRMLVLVQRNRDGVTNTQSGMIATLVPLTGIIGYNSARGVNAPTNAAMAAGGLATYTVGTSLAQSDRLLIYDAGVKSISCAITTYGEGHAQAGRQQPLKKALRDHIGLARKSLRQFNSNSGQIAVEGYLVTAELAAGPDQNDVLDAQLRTVVSNAVNAVNDKLTLTVPNMAKAFDSSYPVWTSIKAPPKPDKPTTEMAVAKAGPATKIDAAVLEQELDIIDRLYRQLEVPPSVDLKRCQFQLSTEVSAKYATAPLWLGATDNANGTTIPAKKKVPIRIRIYGGLAPFDKAVTQGAPPPPALMLESENGAVFLTITPDEKSTGDYVIAVTDASGQEKRVTVSVAD
ncbi:hypothetical protein [Lysobacter solisilvae (ex Woo and Kim 2020)]|uniref:Uncharacterized protein n=1 Tax=Agrilutibacter terrestris TaxID=2865112 RepID=A0A7H0FWU6_9GAMM|nr:hypothetical protein [Lysobacter terrestris]QNP40512.1 hypothetical protein H8B22_13745 [Lysobacter terrestris]